MTHQRRCGLAHMTRAKRISDRVDSKHEEVERPLWAPSRRHFIPIHFIPIQEGVSYVNSKSGATNARTGDTDIRSDWYCIDTARKNAHRSGRLWSERIGAHRSATCHIYQQ